VFQGRLGKPGDDCERVVVPLYAVFHSRYMEAGVPGVLEWLAGLRTEVRSLFATHACWIDGFPGGFYLFYSLSRGILGPEAAEGFRALGLPACAEAVAEANEFFGPEFPRDLQTRQRLLPVPRGAEQRDWDAFADLDERFFASLDRETEPGGFLAVADRYAQRCCVSAGA
jgi:hypothetical protein